MLVDVRQDCIHFLCSAHGVGLCREWVFVLPGRCVFCADPTASCLPAAAYPGHLVPSSSLFFALIQFELAHPSTPLTLPFLYLDF